MFLLVNYIYRDYLLLLSPKADTHNHVMEGTRLGQHGYLAN